MALARAKYLGIIKEAGGWGTGGVPTTFLEFLTCNVKKTVEKIPSVANINQRYINDIYPGSVDIAGSFDIEANPDNIGLLMYMALGVEAVQSQVLGIAAEVTEITCEADIAGSLSGLCWLLNAPGTEYYVWYDVDGMGSVDPALPGKTGILVGIAQGAINTVVATATALAINALGDFAAPAPGAAVVEVTNAANGSVDDACDGPAPYSTGWVGAWVVTTPGSGGLAYDHVFTAAPDATDLDSFVLEVGKQIKQMRYAGCRVNTLALSAAKGSILKATFGVVGQSEDDTVGVAPGIAYSPRLAYVFDHGLLKIDDGVVAYVKSFDLTLDNLLNVDGYMLDGSNVRGSLDKQGINLTGTMTLEYIAASYAQRTAYLDNTTKWLTLIFTSSEAIEPGYFYTMTVDIKYVKYTEAGDDIGGRDAIPLTIGWTAKAPAAGQEFIKVTLRDALAAKWSA